MTAWLNHFWLYGTAITFQAPEADLPTSINALLGLAPESNNGLAYHAAFPHRSPQVVLEY